MRERHWYGFALFVCAFAVGLAGALAGASVAGSDPGAAVPDAPSCARTPGLNLPGRTIHIEEVEHAR